MVRFLFLTRRGCATSEEILWKLDVLQGFIRDLHWVCSSFSIDSIEKNLFIDLAG